MSKRISLFLRLLTVLSVLSIAVLAVSTGEASTNEVTISDISRTLSSAGTVFARFDQERNVSMFSESLKSDGFLCFMAPRSIRWEISHPYRSILICDGKSVSQFEWMNDRWQKLDTGLEEVVRQVTEQIAMILQGRFAGSGNDAYTVSMVKTNGVVLTLVPKQKNKTGIISYMSVRMSPDLKELRSVVLAEPDGDGTTISFSSVKTNVTFSAGTFDARTPMDGETIIKKFAPQGEL